jgi:hypothetical protein
MSINPKDYDMSSIGIEALVGRKIVSASINLQKDYVVLETDKGKLFLTWEGDCCAHCFLANVSGVSDLIGATILSAENAGWSEQVQVDPIEDPGSVTQSMGTNIRTDKGYVTFESRVEHNGYYGGKLLISDYGPIDAYSSLRDVSKETMVPLEDF